MRNVKTALVLVILLALPNLAAAVTLGSLNGTADCNSWSADLTIDFRDNAMMARVEYAVVLLDDTGAEVERFDFSEFVEVPDTPAMTYTHSGAWTAALDGNYTVTADFIVYDLIGDGYNITTGSFTVALACGSAGGDEDPVAGPVCLYGSRFWSENPAAWPVSSLDIGGQNMDQTELMNVLAMHNNRFPMFILMRELIAARLNLANGGSDEILNVANRADSFLLDRTATRRGAGRARGEAMRLKAVLAKYNRSGCPDDMAAGVTMEFDGGFDKSSELVEKAAIEVMTMGTIKAMYR